MGMVAALWIMVVALEAAAATSSCCGWWLAENQNCVLWQVVSGWWAPVAAIKWLSVGKRCRWT